MATFSVTDRQTYRRCRRKWDYSSNMRRNLTNVGAGAEPLELGSLIHRALADWIVDDTKDQQREGRLGQLFLVHAAARQAEISTTFENQTGRKIDPKNLEALHNVVMLGLAMMNNYQAYHKSPLPPHMSFALPEQEVLIPVPGTQHECKNHVGYSQLRGNTRCNDCDGSGTAYHYLSATLDGLVQDNKDRFLVLEHKTYENRPKPMDLFMNDQFTGYAWVVKQLGIGKIAGIAYDGMWKREKPPKYMQKERRAGTIEDLFIRKTIPKSEEELDQWGENLALEITEMANNPPIYPNVPWSGCQNDCNFIEVCYMTMRGEDPSNLIKMKYTQREKIVRGGNTA